MELIRLLEEELRLYGMNSVYIDRFLKCLRYCSGTVDLSMLIAQTLIALDTESKTSRDTIIKLLQNKG